MLRRFAKRNQQGLAGQIHARSAPLTPEMRRVQRYRIAQVRALIRKLDPHTTEEYEELAEQIHQALRMYK